MKIIEPAVLNIIKQFVAKKECFTSLDVYCMLGVRFNDEVYPIYEQVADAYRNGEMGQYLTEIVHLPLEHGSSANVWRYYLPRSDSKKFVVSRASDGSLLLNKKVLGHFPLLGVEFKINILDGIIRATPEQYSDDTVDVLFLPAEALILAKISTKEVNVVVFENRIEITEKC